MPNQLLFWPNRNRCSNHKKHIWQPGATQNVDFVSIFVDFALQSCSNRPQSCPFLPPVQVLDGTAYAAANPDQNQYVAGNYYCYGPSYNNPFTVSDSGQQTFTGMSKPGKTQYDVYLDRCTKARAKKASKDKELAYLTWKRQEKGLRKSSLEEDKAAKKKKVVEEVVDENDEDDEDLEEIDWS